MKKLQRRDWGMWFLSVLVMLLLTAAVVSLSLPALLSEPLSYFQFNLDQAVRGLVGLVLLFNIYALYQQWLLKRLQRQLAQQIELAARLGSRAEVLQKLAMLDPLTNLHNRRSAEEHLSAEVARASRHSRALTLILLDLDDFKKVNDRFGHAAGDLVLKTFADRLSTVIRASDCAVRFGGDEFLLILPECTLKNVVEILDRLGMVVAEFNGTPIPIHFTAGWAGYEIGDTPETLLERADRMLYQQKGSILQQKRPAVGVTSAEKSA